MAEVDAFNKITLNGNTIIYSSSNHSINNMVMSRWSIEVLGLLQVV